MWDVLIPIITALISGIITYLTVRYQANNEIEKIQSQAKFDIEKAEQQFKYEKELMSQRYELDLQAYKDKSTNDAVTGLMKGDFSISGLAGELDNLEKTMERIGELDEKLKKHKPNNNHPALKRKIK